MANIRRTKLKAIRVGCNVSDVEKCKTKEEIEKLVNQLNKETGANHDSGSGSDTKS